MLKKTAIFTLISVMTLVVGCSTGDPVNVSDEDEAVNTVKTVQVNFANATDEPLELNVEGPGLGVGYLGTIPPGGQIKTRIDVDFNVQGEFAIYSYIAGTHSGNFAITETTHPIITEIIPEDRAYTEPAYRHPQGIEQVGEVPMKVNG